MKKIILLTTVFLFCLQFNIAPLQAQTLYGTTFNGGTAGGGTINKFTPATNNLIVAKSFGDIASHPVYTNFIQASDGKLYGMTSQGGSRGNGVIFSYDPSSSIYTKLKDFDGNNGASPRGSLMQASTGKLYGMTYNTNGGGEYSSGVIFSYDPSSFTYTKRKDFDVENDGTANPFGSLVQASDGKLYGMTSHPGGAIFSFDPVYSIYTTLWTFVGTNGEKPYGDLIQASDGKLYGMTQEGGSSGVGVIFSFDPSSSTYTKLKDFDGNNGASPYGSLVQASDGKLFGMTSGGGSSGHGVIFSFDPISSTYTKQKDFDGTNGASPSGSLTQATDGKLYGMTTGGGNSDVGVIFSFDPSSSIYTKLKDFNKINGANPYGSLKQATDGKLYGMTTNGGNSSVGIIFSFDPSSSIYTKLKDFDNTPGAYPPGSLIQASNGKLYGMTSGGGNGRRGEGNGGAGVIYSFEPSTYIYTKLKDFGYPDGTIPFGSLIQASDGNLYGMTINGGSADVGVIFSFDPASSTYTKLKDFAGDDGYYPVGSLMQASDGKLYGMTQYGGSNEAGVIFSFDPSSSIYTKLRDFDDPCGAYPLGSLVQASDGKLYGMTSRNGSGGVGSIFSFDPSSSSYTKLIDFDHTNGATPYGSLIQAKDGKLYGMTAGGGSIGSGVIFSFDPSSSTFTKLKDFDSANGGTPFGTLLQASDGKLYGMTNRGGSNDLGVVFSFDPSTSTYTKLEDFNGTNGANPSFGSAFIEVNEPNKAPVVKITSPADGATFTALATIILSADASDEDGTIKTVDFYNGNKLIFSEKQAPFYRKWYNVPVGNYSITAKATDNNGNVTTSGVVNISVVPDKAPWITITSPTNGATFTALATITLSAKAGDEDGTIKTVDFYDGNTLIFSEKQAPYERKWYNVRIGNYSITARATDNNGVVTTSEAVNISVVPDIAPLVSITSPADGATYTAPATIQLRADASDMDGTIKTVDFYNGSTLIFTEKAAPFERKWYNVPEGNYSITAVATDNNGKKTTSASVSISVTAAGKSIATAGKLNFSAAPLSLNVNPNPVAKTLNISVYGLQTNNRSAISVLSVSGVVLKNIQSNTLNRNVQLDVSSLSAGVYFIKVINGDKILYKQFVKL